MWLEHLLFGARPWALTLVREQYAGVFSDQSFLHTTARTAVEVRKFIDNTERKDQRGKEKQKEKSVLI